MRRLSRTVYNREEREEVGEGSVKVSEEVERNVRSRGREREKAV